MSEITLENGLKVRTYGLPKDFQFLKANDTELQKHGLPARPREAHHLARYNNVLSQLGHKLHYIEPTFRVNSEKKHGPRRKTTAGSETSGNWSGAVIFAPANDSYKWVQGDWVVPNVDAPTQNQWYYCASWIGIDGDGSDDVCQAGVECEVYRSGSSLTCNIYPWWEWYPEAEVGITNLAVRPGDMVTMLICTQGAGSTAATVFYSNRTTGASTWFTFNAPGGTALAGNCAEWIVEAPTVGGSQSAIADYGEVFFTVCDGVTRDGATINGGTGDNINMTAGGGTVSEGILVTPTIVECLYTGSLPH